MSTMEHLFMQIFERKRWIEDQLKQQTESCSQSMAYNLLAHGVRIPSWIWTDGSDAAGRPDAKELNKEQLISGILLPLSRTATPLTNHNTSFTLPDLKGDHVSQSNSFFGEMCAMNKIFNEEQRVKAVPNSDHKDSERGPDMIVEVGKCAEIDPFARIQRSRSRQRDLEIRSNTKANSANHLGKGIIINEHTGRMTRSRAALAKADCVKESSKSLIVPDKGGDRVTLSRFTAQKLDCLGKSLKPAKPVDWVEDAAHKATETEKDCGSVLPISVDNLMSDAARSAQSGLKMTHVVASELSETLSLIEPKKLLFDGIRECGLNEKSAYDFEKENPAYSSGNLTKLEIVQSVKEDSCRDPKKENSSLASRHLREDVLHIAERMHRGAETDRISFGDPEEERVELHEVEDSACDSYPISCDEYFQKPALSPIKETRWISGNASTQPSPMRDCTLNSSLNVQRNVSMKCLSGTQVDKTTEEQCSDEHMKESSAVVCRSFRPLHSLNKNSVASFEKDPEKSFSDSGFKNSETVQSMKELSWRDAITAHVSPENQQLQAEDVFFTDEVMSREEAKISGGAQEEGRLELLKAKVIKEPVESPVQLANTGHCDGSAIFFSESNEVLLEAEEANTASIEVERESASQPSTMPDEAETHTAMQEFRHSLGNSAINDKISVSCWSNSSVLTRNKSSQHLSDQGTVVEDLEKFIVLKMPRTTEVFNTLPKANYFLRSSTSMDGNIGSRKLNDPVLPYSETNCILLKNDVNEIYVGLKDVAENNAAQQTIATNTIETQNTPSKSRYFLRSLSGRDRNAVSSKTNENDDARGAKPTMGSTARACEISWPQRRKMGDRSNNIFATSPRLRLEPLQCFQDSSDCRSKVSSENASGSVMVHQPFPLLGEMETEISNAASKSSLEMLHKSKKQSITEGGPYLKGKDQAVVTPLATEHTQEAPYLDLALGSSRNRLKDELTILKLKPQSSSKDGWDFLHAENSSDCEISKFSRYYEEFIKETETCGGEKSLALNYTAGLSHYHDDLVGCGETMLELEGFSIGVPSPMDDEILINSPELTCFRIDEESSSTEGNGHLDELGTSEEMVGSRGKFSTNRKALVDITAAYKNSPNLVSESEKFVERGSLDSVNTGSSFGRSSFGTHMGLGNGYPKNRRTKLEAKENLPNRPSKQEMSVKANERNRSQANLVKGCKPSNIVSNLSSFVPIVRQKQQEAAPVKGKKEIKVKALEVAEVAKRLEEKKQNERETRKAAAKLERERLEQENARRLEVKQKQKEEEKRKKEVDIAARKRQREEEEERKGKGRKRRCTEETQKQQKLQEERLRSEKEERLRRKDEDEMRKQDQGGEAKRKRKPESGVTGCQKPAEAEPCATKIVQDNVDHRSNSLEANDASKNRKDAEKFLGLHIQAKQDGKPNVIESQDMLSYEMSPYMDSDDEDGEEESRRKRKYIPLWARREQINEIILSTKDRDPLEIFSHKRSFDLSEVLLPRIRRRPL